jgi:threonine dehydrogenase-like Zn-dependent dehydrogenase
MASAGLFPGPYPVGHELVGEVVRVGGAVERRRVGERVVVPFQVSCGECGACRGRRFAACEAHRAPAGAAFGFGPAGGGHGGALADLLLVPHADHLLFDAPSGLSAAALSTLSDNVPDGYRTVAPPLAAHPGAEVLVLGGAGDSIAYYAVLFARALGAGQVRYADTDPLRCAVAERLGACVEHVGDTWPRRLARAPITVAYTAGLDGLHTAIRSTDDYGWCTSAGIQFEPTSALPLLEMYTKGITLHASRADARRLLPEVLELVAGGRFDPLAVPTTVVPWADAVDAWLAPGTKLVVSDEGAPG